MRRARRGQLRNNSSSAVMSFYLHRGVMQEVENEFTCKFPRDWRPGERKNARRLKEI